MRIWLDLLLVYGFCLFHTPTVSGNSVVSLASIHKSLEVRSLIRTIDVTTRIGRYSQKVLLHNPTSQDAEFFFVAVPSHLHQRLGYAFIRPESGKRVLLEDPPADIAEIFPSLPQGIVLLKVPIRIPKQTDVVYNFIYYVGSLLEPSPKKISFTSSHIVKLVEGSVVLSPYRVQFQETRIVIPKGTLRQKSDALSELSTSIFRKTTPEEQAPFTLGTADLFMRFELETHLGKLSHVSRQLEVSHWGTVNVHEFYQFENEAASLNEEYNRWSIVSATGMPIGRQRAYPGSGYPEHRTCFQIDSILPRSVYALDYFDEIGNVSSSYASRHNEHVLLELEPRYPVLGSWKADWHLTYSLPTNSVVSRDQQVYRVALPLGHGFKQIFTEGMDVTILLPEGAHDIEVTLPRSLRRPIIISPQKGWLDLFGSRPMVHLDVGPFSVPDDSLLSHNLEIRYRYSSRIGSLLKPLTCAFLAFIPFLLVSITSRIDTRIRLSKGKPSIDVDIYVAEARQLATELLQANNKLATSLDGAVSERQCGTANVEWLAQVTPLCVRFCEISSRVSDLSEPGVNVDGQLMMQLCGVVTSLVEMMKDLGNSHERINVAVEERRLHMNQDINALLHFSKDQGKASRIKEKEN